jgi:hypothetical protein
MTVLRDNIAAFDAMRPDLESKHRNQWVLFHRGKFVGAYPDFGAAAASAEQHFDVGPFLIRRVGVLPVRRTGRGAFTLAHGLGSGRL